MAETTKTLKTRIQLKYDTLANWNAVASTFVPNKGEVCFVEIPTGDTTATTAPTVLFKVGDGKATWGALKWGSALAADVYAWAKAASPQAIIDSAVGAVGPVVKSLNGLTGNITIDGDNRITFTAAGSKITASFKFTDADKTVLNSGITAAKVSTYDGYQAKIDAKYTKPANGIPKTDLDESVQASLAAADNAVSTDDFNAFKTQNTQNIADAKAAGTAASAALESYKKTNEAALAKKVDKTITVNGHALSANVTVTKDDVGLGKVVNAGQDTAPTANSTNYVTSGGVKKYVDDAIGGVTQFDIVKVDTFGQLPTTGKKGVIYIVPHTHSDSNDTFDEYIWNTSLTTPKYEKIGNTDVNLDGYVNALSGTANSGVVTNITKSGSTISVTSTNLTVNSPTKNGTATEFIDSVSQAANGKITATKKGIPTATASALGLVKGGTTAGKNYGVTVAADGSMTVNVPWTDTNTNDNQTVKTSTTTFDKNAAIEIKGGVNVTVSATNTTTEKSITINGKSDADIKTLAEAQIKTHAGVDKVGTVTSVGVDTGLALTGTASVNPTIGFDSNCTFILDCGGAPKP